MKKLLLACLTLTAVFACSERDEDVARPEEVQIEYWVPDVFAAAGDTEVTLDFGFPGTTATGNETLLDPDFFRVVVLNGNSQVLLSLNVPVDSTKVRIGELNNGVSYQFKVEAIVDDQVIRESNLVVAIPLAIAVPKIGFESPEPDAVINSISNDKSFFTYTVGNQLKLFEVSTQEITNISESGESGFFTVDWLNKSNKFVYRYTDLAEVKRRTSVFLYDVDSQQETVMLSPFEENGFGNLGITVDDAAYYYVLFETTGNLTTRTVWSYNFNESEPKEGGEYRASDFVDSRRISSLSNDGENFLLYGYFRERGEDGFYRYNHVTGQSTFISNFREVYHGPRIASDNERFAFTSNVTDKEELWIYHIDSDEYVLASNTSGEAFLDTPHFLDFRWINNNELSIILYNKDDSSVPNKSLIISIN
ncbi:MAG: hypothetical protein AAFQ94_22255 [Bacteroidota bacterium]